MKNNEETEFDAIVVGSGISGGWAAKELCEKGLKTLVLERGRDVKHNEDYPTALQESWDFPHRGRMSKKFMEANPLITRAAGFSDATDHFFIQDADHPYVQEKPFDWIRGYQVGGKSLTWGRACQRWSDYEFKAPAKFEYGIEWPIAYEDVKDWYSHVERFIGVCGNADGLEAMPDGEYLPPFELNCVEQHFKEKLLEKYGRHLVQGRWAQLSKAKDIHYAQGRSDCQARNKCMRGCPYGGYFSSVSSTLPWAEKTGNLTLRPHSVVHSIVYDETTGKAAGVKVIDANSKEEIFFKAKVIFMNASALNTNLILLNSKSNRFPKGLGNDHDLMGRYICFHLYRGSVNGKIDGFEDKYFFGRKPSEPILVNFRNVGKQEMDFVGGYTTFMGAYRDSWDGAENLMGADLKNRISTPGQWHINMYMQGETIPKATNRVYLSEKETDSWGIPLLVTDVDYDENDEKMVADFLNEGKAMLEAAGCYEVQAHDSQQAPGLDIHEMGGVRMGKDPETSLLNEWNQLHACQNVFVTDGACMTSTGNQSPSILYMALTARATNYAAEQVKSGKL
ncbi:GMC family oxidoreductase [Marinilongibacter aquaticus]|uniref:GMC oxidoreductase n=1 Tax=Marinilongibacter aquaticus TaxID=2975157 RepID=UPI0021BD4B72|nr:GMC family oxidoreductase [Marinilongibacter aquaticus]UBM60442.1 GMC family oxidoreductase [Marinilongibacter aquaticus]